MNARGWLKIERFLETTPIFSRRPADMEMRNESGWKIRGLIEN